MKKHPLPYYRAQRDTWCVQIGKRQITLAKGREAQDEAWEVYHREMGRAGFAVQRKVIVVGVAIDEFLSATHDTISAGAFQQYQIKLADLASRIGKLDLESLRGETIVEWVKGHEWSNSTKRGAITIVKTWLNWCCRKGLIPANPARDLKKPKAGRRERTITPVERLEIRAEFGDGFGDFLDALTWTGCLPAEIWDLEAKHLDLEGGYASLPGKTTEQTGDLIEFPLVAPMLELCSRLARERPNGPLFLNRMGRKWNRDSVRLRMARLRKRFPELAGITAYTYRHSFATDHLARGTPLTDVSALMNQGRSILTPCDSRARALHEDEP